MSPSLLFNNECFSARYAALYTQLKC